MFSDNESSHSACLIGYNRHAKKPACRWLEDVISYLACRIHSTCVHFATQTSLAMSALFNDCPAFQQVRQRYSNFLRKSVMMMPREFGKF